MMLVMTSLDVLNKLTSKHIENMCISKSGIHFHFELQVVSNTFIKWFLKMCIYKNTFIQMFKAALPIHGLCFFSCKWQKKCK